MLLKGFFLKKTHTKNPTIYHLPTLKALEYISAFPRKNLKHVVVIIVGIQFNSLFPFLINIQITSHYGHVLSIITVMIVHQSSL